jgi:hypothetical protein
VGVGGGGVKGVCERERLLKHAKRLGGAKVQSTTHACRGMFTHTYWLPLCRSGLVFRRDSTHHVCAVHTFQLLTIIVIDGWP